MQTLNAWDDDYTETADKANTQRVPAPKLTKAQRRAQHLETQKQLWDSGENPSRNLWLEARGVVPLRQEFKPQVTVLSRRPPTSTKQPDESEESDEDSSKKRESELQERQRQARIEREEKAKRYAEARERIMGTSSRESSQGRDLSRRGRGGRGGNRNSRPQSRDLSPATGVLYDPNDSGKWTKKPATNTIAEPIRQPRGPDGGARGGFFVRERA
ncbi:hypothetical protein K470DRAFT_268684 [Piedraia hortae CBS 480.64]|uniref:Uncharacterized protein n=1 Tax=Piedraia hortae CBS 480.64 TaxID=1314780 RepID=A0A6A7C556_9PEZI|nr:hypothetical protein K470DRAFT_268684 [Piedraia hortae CBS 480.64]